MIFHITSHSEWQRAVTSRSYRGDTLDTEGFIHCSTPAQVTEVANRVFPGRTDLLLLSIDPAKLHSELRYELAANGQHYPHIYGPLNIEAVTESRPLLANEHGRFQL